jgi:uncharacterized YigZ family protein
VEETIRKSRFITALGHAPTPEAALAFVEQIRETFPDATHHCWAYVAGPPGDTASIGLSDGGEPHGTAGRPMLTSLLHSGVGDIVAVCSRYYGGTKLGTGGLSRAYGGGVRLALETLPTDEKVDRTDLWIQVEYDALEPLRRLLQEAEALVEKEAFTEVVEIWAAVPTEKVEVLARRVADLTRGKGTLVVRDGAEGEAVRPDPSPGA